MREELESERGGDLVGDVGDAEVEVGEVDFHDIAVDDLELVLVGGLRAGASSRSSRWGGEGWVGLRMSDARAWGDRQS